MHCPPAAMFIVTALLLAAVCAGQEPTAPPDRQGWTLTFHDEFDQPQLDETKWHTYYRDARTHYVIEDGVIHVRIDAELPLAGANKTFRCSSIQTSPGGWVDWPGGRPFAQQHGWFEISARCAEGSGRHMAFWMMPADAAYNKLVEDGGTRRDANEAVEIDIFEQLGRDPMSNHFTVHFGRRSSTDDRAAENAHPTLPFDASADFHVYALEWTREKLVWYVDGDEVFRSDKSPQAPFYILLGNYENCGWTGPLDTALPYPRDFEIRYIRVYQPAD